MLLFIILMHCQKT